MYQDERLHTLGFLEWAGEVAGRAAFGPNNAAGRPPTPPNTPEPIQVTRLTDRLHLLTGAGGNIAVFAADGGTLIVDSGLAPRAADVAKAVAGVRSQRVVTLINTHWHGDHTGGNERFGNAGARIVAHENTRRRLSREQFQEAFNRRVPPAPRAALPTVTFPSARTLRYGGEELRLFHVAPAHTDTDVAIFFPRANVLHTGDLFFNGFYPFIDYSTGGWLGGMVAAADRLLATAGANTKIIPGHGPLATRADLRVYRSMLATVLGRLEPMARANKTVDEVVAVRPTADLDARWGKGFMQPEQFVRIAYTGIVRHRAAARKSGA